MDMLTVKDLYKSFGSKEVLKGVNLSVPEHSIFGFIGKNGAGKTTTMKAILGLLRPDSGEIYVNGERVTFGETKTNRFIGYLPDVPNFYSFMNAREYLKYSADIADISIGGTDGYISELLELVGLGGVDYRIKGFSRGMKQRLGIAQALLNKPKLLICDEPTSALDPIGRKEILDLLLSVKEETTVLFSTHILSDVERICTDVAFLNNGIISIQGKISDVKDRYHSNDYIIETENPIDTEKMLQVFPSAKPVSQNQFMIADVNDLFYEVLRYITLNCIAVLKIEKAETSLESLFMEADKI